MTRLLGKTASGPIEAAEIELWELGAHTHVAYQTDEFSALCPVTLQPDIYDLTITYSGDRTFESKGMKHYLWGFRDQGISCEGLAARLSSDLSTRIELPVTVTLVQQVRGGLVLSATVTVMPHE